MRLTRRPDGGTPITNHASFSAAAYGPTSYKASLTDSDVQAVVANALTSNALQTDPKGVYFVLTSADVNESSGFCTQYCGWHTHANINGADIKYAFVGNPDRCPSSCSAQTSTESRFALNET